MAERSITPEETAEVDELIARGRAALRAFEGATQEQVDRLCQAIGWAVANETDLHAARPHGGGGERYRRPRVAGVQALQGHGHPARRPAPAEHRGHRGGPREGARQVRQARRAHRFPRAHHQPRVDAARGLPVRYQMPRRRRVLAAPRSKATTLETVSIMRRVLEREGAPPDLLQCLGRPSIPAARYLMTQADLVQATGGRDMVKAAYSSGTPAYGVGAGNSTMVIDETADIAQAARNTRISKTSDYGSGCSSDGNLVVEASHRRRAARVPGEEGATSPIRTTPSCCGRPVGRRGQADGRHHRISAQAIAGKAGFDIAAGPALLRRPQPRSAGTTRSARRS